MRLSKLIIQFDFPFHSSCKIKRMCVCTSSLIFAVLYYARLSFFFIMVRVTKYMINVARILIPRLI